MRKTRPWLYVFLPVLYLSLIFGLVVFQFSKKSDTFSQSLGDMTVSGKTSETGDPVDLSLRGRGLEFQFSSGKTLTLVDAEGVPRKLRPTKWAWKDGNLVVQFQEGVVITFEKTGAGGGVLLLQPSLPAALAATTATLRLPFAGENGGRVEHNATRPLVVITRGNQQFLASLDGSLDQIDADDTFVLAVRSGKVRPVRLEGLAEGSDPVRQWLVQSTAAATVADAQTALQGYVDKAYKAWGDTRFRPGQGGWLTSEGSVRFSSRLVAAWAHEALVRGNYAAMYARVQSLLADSPNPWNFDALPYLGNLMEVTQAQRRTVEALNASSAPDWTAQPRLWLDTKFYGPPGATDRLQKLLLTGDLPGKTPELLGFLANLVSLKASAPEADSRITMTIGELLTKVVRNEGGLFVATADGYYDLKSGLILGKLLLDQSSNVLSESWQAIGAQLVLSALQLQDTQTRIPEVVVTTPGQGDRPEGGFYPEELGATVLGFTAAEVGLESDAPNSNVPAGAFVRSALPLVGQSLSAGQWKLTFQFPAGSAESILVVGLPPFDSVLLHGIRWRTDPQFQMYTDGWYYSASTQTLYVKIKHREEQEQLIINIVPQAQ